jgi:hypothetical protein
MIEGLLGLRGRGLEWAIQLILTLMLPAMMGEALVLGVTLTVHDLRARLTSLRVNLAPIGTITTPATSEARDWSKQGSLVS